MAVGRVSLSLSGLGVLALAIGLSQCRPAGSPPPPSTEILLPEASFRVRLGLLDSEPGIWSGRLVPVPGQKLELRPDEFRANIYRHSFLDSIHSVDADPQLPNDQIKGKLGWVAATRMSWARRGKSALRHPSVIVSVLENPGDQPIRIETAKGSVSFRPDGIQLFQAETFLEGAVVVESVPPSSPLAPERFDIQDYPAMTATRSGKLWAAWQEYVEGEADQVVARSRGESGWGPVHLLDSDVDAFRTAVAEDSRADLGCLVCPGGGELGSLRAKFRWGTMVFPPTAHRPSESGHLPPSRHGCGGTALAGLAEDGRRRDPDRGPGLRRPTLGPGGSDQ